MNFNWGEDEEIVPGTSREYVSIEWEGYLLVEETGNYKFEVEADDGVALSVNQVSLIDDLTENPDETEPKRITSAEISLSANSLVPIKVRAN